MADYTDRYTDKEFKALSKQIEKTYAQAYKDIGVTIRDYFAKFEKRDAEMQIRLESGEIDLAYYRQWRLNQIGRGERFQAMRQQVAERMTNANETAIRYVNDTSVNVYTTARNYAAYTIEQTGANINFALMNENAVREAMRKGAETMPYYDETFPMAKVRLLTNKDIAYGKKQITKTVTSALIQGKDIKAVADELQQRITTMDRTSALRSARTALGSAQNAGHQAAYKAAEDKGIKGKKRWDAVIDPRTRDSHAELDGVTVDVDEEFPNGLLFPKDPNGEPAEVYNCRCRITYVLDRLKDDFKSDHTAETFEEWKNQKENGQTEQPDSETIKPITNNAFIESKTIQDAEQFVSNYVDENQFGALGVSYSGVSVDVANSINKAVSTVFENFELGKLGGVFTPTMNSKLGKQITNAQAAYSPIRNSIIVNRTNMKNMKTAVASLNADNDAVRRYLEHPENFDLSKARPQVRNVLINSAVSGRGTVPDTIEEAIYHELGHSMEKTIKAKGMINELETGMAAYGAKISGYATDSFSEYVAESFCSYMKGENVIDPKMFRFFEGLRK